ncbi:MAG: uracil-xanthine permease family protein [Lachnospirales bacterium]
MEDNKNLIYQLDGRPSLKYAFPLGMQHVLAMFVSNIAPILILASAINLSPEDTRVMVQAVMFTSGVTTLLQLYSIKIGKIRIGNRLPVVMGISFAFVSVATSVGVEYGLGAVFGASIIAAFLEVIIGLTYKYIKDIFNPLVTGSLLVALGLYLIGVGADYYLGGFGEYRGTPQALGVATVTLFVVLALRIYGKGILKSSSVLIGMIVGYVISIAIGMVNFSGIGELSFVSFRQLQPFAVAKPEFVLPAIVSFVVVYFATAVETIGDTKGVCVGGLNREATEEEISGGLLGDATGSIFASIFNGLPNTSFGQNVGIVSSTKIVNRFVIATGAMFLIVISFFPQFAEFFRLIPDAVLGGALITVFAIITANGLKVLEQAGPSDNNLFILAIAFAIGLGLGGNETFLGAVPSFIGMFFSTTVATTAIVAIIASFVIKPDYSKGTYGIEENSYIEE